MAAYEGVDKFNDLKDQITQRCLDVGLLNWFTAIRLKIEADCPNYSKRDIWAKAWDKVEEAVVQRESGLGSAPRTEAEDKAPLANRPDPASQSGGSSPPPPTPATDIPLVEDPAKAFFDEYRINGLKDIAWIYHNLGNKKANLLQAPSPGARYLLETLRALDAKERMEWYKTYLPKLMPKETADKDQERMRDDGRKIISLVERLQKSQGKKA